MKKEPSAPRPSPGLRPPSPAPASEGQAKVAFEMRKVRLALETILPVRQFKNPTKNIVKFRTILASIREVGLVEPLMVHPQRDKAGIYLLLDGHLRYFALKQMGETQAECIIATDDECFTYNARVSRMPAIQSHKMIVKAVQNGVRPERIAAALSLDPSEVRSLMTLLDGINEEAAELLKDKNVFPQTLRMLRRVTGVRQIEIAELMVIANNFARGYAEALILGTPKDQLVNGAESKKKAGMSAEEIGRMEREMESLERDFKAIEGAYAENMMNLTLARGYIRRLLDNGKVVRFLSGNHSDVLAEFERIAASEGV